MVQDDERLSQDALEYVKRNKGLLVSKFASDLLFPSAEHPISGFMAGSPGAGKTEFSKNLLSALGKNGLTNVVRIDADEIRLLLPGYNGKNASIFQYAASVGVEKLHDYVIKRNKHFILDGTLHDYDKAKANIDRSIVHGRLVMLYYVYQDPVVAWKFTKKREIQEGRCIPMDDFINQFLLARETVGRLIEEYRTKKEKVEFVYIEKNIDDNKVEAVYPKVDQLDKLMPSKYSKEDLIDKLAKIEI